MDEAVDTSGYIYEVPLSTVALAGGRNGLLELFASRARGFFRHLEGVVVEQDNDCLRVNFYSDWLILDHDGGPDGSQVLRLRLRVLTSGTWTSEHQSFAELIAVWPEVTAWRPMPRPARENLDDEQLVAAARAIVIADQKASTSYVQRKLKIGYNRAATVIEQLERDGVISPPDVSGRRNILVTA